MFRKLSAIFALLFALTACAAPIQASEPAAPAAATVQHAEEAEVLWPAVDNQYAALVQCHYFLGAGADRDDCVSAAFAAFPTIAACAEEDSAGPCYWSASTRGTGTGESFTVDAAGVVTYLSAAL